MKGFTENKQRRNKMKAKTIVNALKEAGMEVEHYINDENIECVLVDNYPYSQMLLDLTVGVNGQNLPAVFGYYSDANGKEWSLSGSIHDWHENFGKEIPSMVHGYSLSW